MAKKKQAESYFWTSYSDLMTSLFFIMLVLFVLAVFYMQKKNALLTDERNNAKAKMEQLEQIVKLNDQFRELSESSSLEYIEKRKMFVAKQLIGIEIFEPDKAVIKPSCLQTVDEVGRSLQDVVTRLHQKNPQLKYLLIIEGNTAIPWRKKRTNTYNPDRVDMYELSYKRALALYMRWHKHGIDFRKANTEVIISGSGFNGINRDNRVEENNKRFVVQIVPKVSRPVN